MKYCHHMQHLALKPTLTLGMHVNQTTIRFCCRAYSRACYFSSHPWVLGCSKRAFQTHALHNQSAGAQQKGMFVCTWRTTEADWIPRQACTRQKKGAIYSVTRSTDPCDLCICIKSPIKYLRSCGNRSKKQFQVKTTQLLQSEFRKLHKSSMRRRRHNPVPYMIENINEQFQSHGGVVRL